MDNIELEKERTDVIDQQPINDATTLPEQPSIPKEISPHVFDLDHWIKTWQPMGIRITVNLPFIGDDSTPIFYIRANPYIPYYYNRSPNYIYNLSNTFPIILGSRSTSLIASDLGIQVTQYDNPPPLAILSRSFRRWRGSLQYRIRTVGNFTQQAYLQSWPIYNRIPPVGIHNPWATNPILPLKDDSFMEGMLNSYVMSDLSFQRHIEVQMPFQFPVKYYDQYRWLNAQCAIPSYTTANEQIKVTSYPIKMPHGENWIALAVRGTIAAQSTGQITFELEYRGGEDFQFADPFVLDTDFNLPIRNWRNSSALNKLYSWPDKTIESDGINTIRKRSKETKV